MKETMTKFFGADPHKSPDYTKIVNEFHYKRLEKMIKEDNGGKIVYKGGDPVPEDRYIPPMILDNPNPKAPLTCSETFGPILSIYTVDDVNAAVKRISSGDKPLAAYYFGNAEGPEKDIFIKNTSSGGVSVNDCATHACNFELPFGGVGFSGTGKLTGIWGFNNLTHWKPVCETIVFDEFPISLKYPPYGENRVKEMLDAMAGPPPPK